MPGISQSKFYSTIRGPAAEALDILAVNSSDIFEAWRREIRALGLHPRHFVSTQSPDFAALADRLRESSYPAFQSAVHEFGEMLAERHVMLHHAVAVLNRLFEVCLVYLSQHASSKASPILALARLQALVSALIVSGYTGQWAAGNKTLIEASLSEDEERRHRASAYVTRIYEQERRRLSQDLHDEIGHDLILLKLYLEMMTSDESASEGLRSRLAEAIALVSHAIDEVRRLVLDLGPAVFEELGFQPAVRSYISQFSSRTRIQVSLREGHLPADIPSSHQVALYRVLQGALSNVLKHASARNVKVSLGSMKDSVLIMIIEDDGVGFDVAANRAGDHSFGLTAMRERVEVLGGKIHVESRPASRAVKTHGTRIEIDLPLPGGDESLPGGDE